MSGAAAGQRHRKQVHQRALGLMDDVGRQVVPPRIDDELGQNLGDARIVQHASSPSIFRRSIGRRDEKRNGSGRLSAILMAGIRQYKSSLPAPRWRKDWRTT